ncbi:MAG: DUF1223 domain-containing protein [Acidobacteriota bacterium]|nr:DUF1223 domain-containing protein [Acidobacteriota bacterium]
MFRHVARVVVVTVAFGSMATAQRPATNSPGEPVLVLAELFTSQGCSSCPPADHVLETLLKEQSISGVHVVALSEHVTYWDHQGWKDPFGSEQFTNRQKDYGFGFNLDSIYTPQLVIDGVSEAVGSDERNIRGMLVNAAKVPKPRLIVEASLKPDGTLHASVSGAGMAGISASDAELWWAITEDNLVVDVKRGENASRTLRHSGVVRMLSSDKVFKPGLSGTLTIPGSSNWKRENLRVVAFLQSKETRRVLSVGFAPVL